MKKKSIIGVLMVATMLFTAVIYYNMLKVEYKELANYSNFLIPETAVQLEENGNFISFTTDEVSDEGMKINYRSELKKAHWTVIEKSKNEFIWSPEKGYSVRVRVKDHQITINHLDD